jgi:hypothetical protein
MNHLAQLILQLDVQKVWSNVTMEPALLISTFAQLIQYAQKERICARMEVAELQERVKLLCARMPPTKYALISQYLQEFVTVSTQLLLMQFLSTDVLSINQ